MKDANKIKRLIKEIPVVGDLIARLYRLIVGQKIIKFRSSSQYWEDRYILGGDSGAGSYNKLAEFKAETINRFVEFNKIETIIEFGCGDGNQLKYAKYKNYIGFDVSNKAINNCKREFGNDRSKRFALMEEFDNESSQLTLSLDVIYHLVEDEVFEGYMNRVFESSERYVIIYSSNGTDVEFGNNVAHVRHRVFTDWVEKNKKNWTLSDVIKNKYPFDPVDNNEGSFADFYFYEKAN